MSNYLKDFLNKNKERIWVWKFMENAKTLGTKWATHYGQENDCKLSPARSLHWRARDLTCRQDGISLSLALTLSTNDVWDGEILCPVHRRMFNTVPGFYLLDACSIPCLSCDKEECLQVSPGRQNHSQLRAAAPTQHSPVFTLHLKLDHKPGFNWQLPVDPDRYPGQCVLYICRA